MALMNVYPVAASVNCFFRTFSASERSLRVSPKMISKMFFINKMKS